MQIQHMLPHRGALRRVPVYFTNHPHDRRRATYMDIYHLSHIENTYRKSRSVADKF